ncbi:MAG: SusC/RagA family TonB-linked outer membrane protein, partial [Sediminibacterium sp.]|nr:SusC/RagA family TonB-linked outer membrane protein [Sediminibacterium sp.]
GTDGTFRLEAIALPDTLLITLTGYRQQKMVVAGPMTSLVIALEPLYAELDEVIVNTGYQALPKERSAGSFVQLDNALVNRRVSSNILDRLDGVTSGLLFNRNRTPAANESAIVIRGRSTLFASPEPLIILDNFPYDGDINNINPNDVENITVLRDAAAASIWGARSGNGVIVITTKKGKQGQPLKVTFNTNLSFGGKPDLYYQPLLDAPGYLAIESFLFGKGHFNSRLSSPYLGISPAVDIFAQRKAGLISAADSASLIEALSRTDARTDLLKYLYRNSITQQYSVAMSGGGMANQFYLSAGYDKTLSNMRNNDQDRITIYGKNTYQLIKDKLELSGDMAFTSSRSNTATSVFNITYPIYTRLVDDDGHALPVYRDYRKKWLDTIGQGQLLDWMQRPYDELSLADNRSMLMDYRLLTVLKYTLRKGWDMTVSYQFEKGSTEIRNLQSQESYFTRDLINRFTQPDYTTRIPLRQVPLGDVLDGTQSVFTSHNARAIMNYETALGKEGRLTILVGGEIKDYTNFTSSRRLFGYNEDNATDIAINPVSQFVTLPAGSLARISLINAQKGLTDRYLSGFGNIGYSFRDRYLLNLSARKDASNLFGVSANQKGIPLWSVGAGWILNREKWFHTPLVSYLKLRLTYGYNGNVDKSTSAFTTAGVGSGSIFLQPSAGIINPPNPELSWEKIGMLNAGLDYSFFRGLLSGSIDYYRKSGQNLIGNSEVASQTGVSQFRQNIADIKTSGFDLVLTAHLLKSNPAWNVSLLYSHVTDEVTRYLLKASQTKAYVTTIQGNPLEGKPWSAVFAYQWAGLGSSTGDPQGMVNGQTSTDYSRLINPLSTAELVYMGAGRPTNFGSIRNDLSWKGFNLSMNLVFSTGYYYRKPAVSYTSTFNAMMAYGIFSNGDLARRWQKPGDESVTNVPSLVYPAVAARDEFFQYAATLVEKGDHLRLRDIRLGYDVPLPSRKNYPIHSCTLYLYANNIGILWRANQSGIDPDNVSGPPAPLTLALGASFAF